MTRTTDRSSTGCSTLDRLSAGLCDHYRLARRHARILQIAHASLTAPDVSGGEGVRSFGLGLVMRCGDGLTEGPEGRLVRCASGELPFVDEAFRSVILYHVIENGDEAELEEACRVLVPGGDLLIIGVNRTSWVGIDGRAWPELPRLHGVRVSMRLRALGMRVEERQGAGLLGRARPAVIGRRWQGLVLPVADVVLLRARHRNQPLAQSPKLKDVPAGLAPTTLTVR